MACGTHGTGVNYGIIASYVLEIEVLLASGDVKTYSRSINPDLFLAFLCSLGSLGIILTATVQCEKLFKLESIQYAAKLDDVR